MVGFVHAGIVGGELVALEAEAAHPQLGTEVHLRTKEQTKLNFCFSRYTDKNSEIETYLT